MAENILQTKLPGDVIDADDPNQYKVAVGGNFVPRNVDGEPTNEAGGLGTSLFRWIHAYLKQINVGSPSSGLIIKEDTGDLVIEVNGNLAASFGELNGTGSYGIKTGAPSLKMTTYTSSGTYDLVSDSQFFIIEAVGGGGGGGAHGTGVGASGGCGGHGSMPQVGYFSEVGGTALVIQIGAGGLGGATTDAPGSPGGQTRVGYYDPIGTADLILMVADGAPGGKTQITTDDQVMVLTPSLFSTAGGKPGTDGQRGKYRFGPSMTSFMGSKAGTGTTAFAGGGGGSSIGQGGNGGNYPGGNPSNGSRGGGGGGSCYLNGIVAKGGDGLVRVIYTSQFTMLGGV